MELFTPKEIVEELDKYIIGQAEAKKSVAVALRNRYRRSCLDDATREEITPKNIIMKGPTGVGKTEIARRLAKLVKAPLVKVEATKFTEVGYVGRDVESMVRDLVEAAIRLVKEERYEELKPRATQAAVAKLGYKNVWIGTVEGKPETTACDRVIDAVAAAGFRDVVLRPLMVVAGDHAHNDMASDDDDSWKTLFNASGKFDSVETQILGLGRLPAIRDAYLARLADAMENAE